MRIKFLSLVDEGANGKRVIYKSVDDDSDVQFEINLRHLRKDATKGIIYATAYEPDTVDYQDDWADAETIEEAAHDFLKSGRVRMVDMHHSYEPGAGTVVESFIKNGPDSRFPDSKDGSWCVAIKLDEATLPHLNEIGGLSMAGGGIMDDAAAPPSARVAKKKDLTKQVAAIRPKAAGATLARIRPNK